MRKYLGLALIFAVGANAYANSLTVRDIKLLGKGKIEIQLDGTPSKDALDVEFVRDIVQFTIQNATLYPAKILHSDEGVQAFSKVFAYQYAPNLVRVRFTIDGKADQFQGKVKWEQNGKFLTVTFPPGVAIQEAKHEQSLIAKVLGQSKEEPKVEKIEDSQVTKAAEVAKVEKVDKNDSESLPVLRSDKNKSKEIKLGGAHSGPSAIRSFLAMFLVVGGLGLVLFYVKKKKNTVQAKKVGNSWISNMLSGNKKPKALIEVIANHPLGPKQSITVVRIRGQQFVLGVTEGNVQLITQLDSDEDIDLLEDPKVADSLGKIFGGKPKVEPTIQQVAQPQPNRSPAQRPISMNDASFGNLLKNSSGAGAIVARNAYQTQQTSQPALQSSVRDQIKQRLQQGMKN